MNLSLVIVTTTTTLKIASYTMNSFKTIDIIIFLFFNTIEQYMSITFFNKKRFFCLNYSLRSGLVDGFNNGFD